LTIKYLKWIKMHMPVKLQSTLRPRSLGVKQSWTCIHVSSCLWGSPWIPACFRMARSGQSCHQLPFLPTVISLGPLRVLHCQTLLLSSLTMNSVSRASFPSPVSAIPAHPRSLQVPSMNVSQWSSGSFSLRSHCCTHS
jgi:hypothetical protein